MYLSFGAKNDLIRNFYIEVWFLEWQKVEKMM